MTSSSSYNDFKSNNINSNINSNINKDKSPNVQESKKTPENKNKRLFILGDSIVKYISGCDISLQIENCRIYVRV